MYHTDEVFHAEQRNGNQWDVYTDLTKEQIKGVDGVSAVYVYGTRDLVCIDPRFDADLVMHALHKLALDNELKEVGGYIPKCECNICKARRALDEYDCRAETDEPDSEDNSFLPLTLYISYGQCKSPESSKVYISGEPVTGWTIYDLTEDVAIVPVKDLEAIQENMAQIRKNSWTIDDAQEHQTSLSYSVTNLIRRWLGK